MQADFYALVEELRGTLRGAEVLLAHYSGETSDFVRFSKNRIRQPGSVEQGYVNLRLIDGQRQVHATLPFAGNTAEARQRCTAALAGLRQQMTMIPEDPYLLYNTKVQSSERIGVNRLPEARDAVATILEVSQGKDLVGIYAAGGIHRGFANSLGQRNWFSSYSFSFDWSYYLRDDKAVKSSYGGFTWDPALLREKVESAGQQLAVQARAPRTIEPGSYDVYLAPSAVQELIGMMRWGGFGKRAHETKQTAFLKMVQGEVEMSPEVTILENTAGGVDADFGGDGFTKPPQVTLIERGRYRDCLVSPRSAKEFGCATNAGGGETPSSIDMAAGTVPAGDVLARLGTGVYVNNLWYLNFSDRKSFRVTGMTRFATFWVENGEIVAPVEVMRFDELIYRIFGENLQGLTANREMILAADSYEERGTSSMNLPGALVKDFKFTL